MQQFEASMFYKVVHWQKLGEVENEYILHNYIVLCHKLSKLVEIYKVMTKTILTFFWDTV